MHVPDWQLLEALGSLPNLRDLRITLFKPKDREALLKHIPATWFPALRAIKADTQLVLRILSAGTSTPWMTDVGIESWSIFLIPNTMQRLIDLIGSSCPNIRKLTSKGLERFNRAPHEEPQMCLASIMPLKDCRNLRDLSVRSDGAPRFPTDEELDELLEAWPRLRYPLIGIAGAPPTSATIALLERRHASGQLDEFKIGPGHAGP